MATDDTRARALFNQDDFDGDDGVGAAAATATVLAPTPSDDDGRQPRVRARTISMKRLSKRELEMGRKLYPDEGYDRPVTREDCVQGTNAERPCPFVSCKHHLYLDMSARSGAIKLNFPNLEVWDMPETCALDIADRGGITLEDVGEIMNLTRERVRQLETRGLAKLKALNELAALHDYVE